jgi:uncharacterized protein
MQRREFLSSAAAAAMLSTSAAGRAAEPTQGPSEVSGSPASRIPRVQSAGTMRGEMLYRELGATGVQVSVIGLGGSHLGRAEVSEDQALQLIHQSLDRGINFLDNSWDYNEGRSEERVGKALLQEGYRTRLS